MSTSTETMTLVETRRDQALADLFCTALEDGIGYWSSCSVYQWNDRTPQMRQINEFRAVITDTESGDDAEYTIDRYVIQRGMNRLYRHLIGLGDNANRYHKQACSNYAHGKWDDLDFDADTADMVVQFGLFGHLVYG